MKAELDTGDQTTDTRNVTGAKHGRTILLSSELDATLRTMKQNMRISGPLINIHTVRSVLFGLVTSHVERYRQYADFHITWVRSLYHRVKLLFHRVLTTSTPFHMCFVERDKHSIFA